MRSSTAFFFIASLAVSACGGGGQTEPTESEEALNNELQPAAPSPGTATPGGETTEAASSTNSAQSAANSH